MSLESLVVFVLLASSALSVARRDGLIRLSLYEGIDAVEVQEGPQHFFDQGQRARWSDHGEGHCP